MTEKDDDDKDKEVALKQYNRFAGDLRFQHTLIWQIPSAALTITTGIVAVSLLHHGLARIIPLVLGELLLFLFNDSGCEIGLQQTPESQFLKDLECDLEAKSTLLQLERLGSILILIILLKTNLSVCADIFVKRGVLKTNLLRDPVYRFLIALIPSAEILLLWGMLFAFVIVLYLIINEIWYFGLRWV